MLAIENFQNAAKFHSIAQMHKEKTKPSYPRLRDAGKSYPERGI